MTKCSKTYKRKQN